MNERMNERKEGRKEKERWIVLSSLAAVARVSGIKIHAQSRLRTFMTPIYDERWNDWARRQCAPAKDIA